MIIILMIIILIPFCPNISNVIVYIIMIMLLLPTRNEIMAFFFRMLSISGGKY